MSIKFVEGDMFSKKYDVLINPCNCLGVMGKGIALEFKHRYPNNFAAYQQYCKLGLLRPGGIFPVIDNNNVLILNAATKNHWKNPTKIRWVGLIVDQLIEVFDRVLAGTTAAIPALGCGNGGLDWKEVKEFMEIRFAHNTDNIKIDIYAPLGK